MTACYVDSSVIVSLLLQEKGSKKYATLLEKSEANYSSHLLEAEVYATATREKIPLSQAEEFIDLISLVVPERSLRIEYRRIFEHGFCRGADACHIATAYYLDPKREKIAFLTADKDQARLARTIGFKVF